VRRGLGSIRQETWASDEALALALARARCAGAQWVPTNEYVIVDV